MSNDDSQPKLVRPVAIRDPRAPVAVSFTRRSVAPEGRTVKFEEIPLCQPTECSPSSSRFKSPHRSTIGSPRLGMHQPRPLLVQQTNLLTNTPPSDNAPNSDTAFGTKCSPDTLMIQQQQSRSAYAKMSAFSSTADAGWDNLSKYLQYTPSPPQARRRLNLESTVGGERKTPPRKVARLETKSSGAPSPVFESPLCGSTSQRYDSSLLLLTKRFVNFRQASGSDPQQVNLNDAAAALGVQKRRLYDITNVLEGIGVIQKVGKNAIRWQATDDGGFGKRAKSLTEENRKLRDKEEQLDQLIGEFTKAVHFSRQDPLDAGYAYTTYQNVRSLESLCHETLVAIRAPNGSSLQSTDPRDTGKYEMKIRSNCAEPVQVFLCPDDLNATPPRPPHPDPDSSHCLEPTRVEGDDSMLLMRSPVTCAPSAQILLTDLATNAIAPRLSDLQHDVHDRHTQHQHNNNTMADVHNRHTQHQHNNNTMADVHNRHTQHQHNNNTMADDDAGPLHTPLKQCQIVNALIGTTDAQTPEHGTPPVLLPPRQPCPHPDEYLFGLAEAEGLSDLFAQPVSPSLTQSQRTPDSQNDANVLLSPRRVISGAVSPRKGSSRSTNLMGGSSETAQLIRHGILDC